ncbi:MAG TPA: hypothetical protein DEB43_01870 [Desulfovibrio sp.]|nr:hypothetical protein [Desulfovibrio sp.]
MRNNFLPYLFFLSLTLVPNVHAQTSRSASMPVPFEPFDTGNAVSAEFLKLYKENPKNTTIPADILAILQNQESLEPPTIIRQAPTSAFERTIFSSEAPITGKINSPYQPIINEIVKDPQLLHNIPLDDLNKLILESTQQYANPAKIQNLPQANNFKLLSAPQKSGQPFQNINDLQKLRIVAAKKELSSQEQESRSLSPKKRTDNSSFSNPANKTAQNKRQINREELEEKSRQGDENAAILLARSYFYDTGEQKNIDKAFKLLEDLAGKKNTRAMLELGRMYEADSPRQNVMRSANYYKQAAELGNIDAKYHLGLLYYKGRFGQGDEALKYAIYAFREAAAKDHAPSMYELATMYETGTGFSKDMGQAVQLYRKSAHLGYAPAQLQVGLLYENGILVPKNETIAAAWYTKAAEQGFPTAQYLLAGMYRQGLGIPKNLDQAHILYESAANTGLVDAQYDLGVFYLLKSKFQNYKKAEYWLQKAAEQNDTQAREILIQLQQKLSTQNK